MEPGGYINVALPPFTNVGVACAAASDRDGGLGVATMRRDRVDGEGGSVGF